MSGHLRQFVVACRPTGYDVVRVGVAILLLVAAALKGHQLATEPILGTGLLANRWVLIGVVEFELLFGVCLLANLWPRLMWAVTVICFGLFAGVSLYKALMGYGTCGCFGRWEVSPYLTGTLDLAIVALLLCWRPRRLAAAAIHQLCTRATCVLAIWLTIGLPAAYAMINSTDTTLSDAGEIIGNGTLVALEPEKWDGKLFPLLRYIEDLPMRLKRGERPLRERLAEGDWIVILYRHNCRKCQEKMPKYHELATRAAKDSTAPRVAMIELPPYGNGIALSILRDGECFFGRLTDESVEWFVETPVEVFVRSARSSSLREQKL